MSSSNFWGVVVFLMFNLVTGPSFKSMSLLGLELSQFLFRSDWPEIRNYLRLSFAQYLKTGVSQGYQIGCKCLWWNVTEYCKMPRLQLLPFLRKATGGIKLPLSPSPRLGLKTTKINIWEQIVPKSKYCYV